MSVIDEINRSVEHWLNDIKWVEKPVPVPLCPPYATKTEWRGKNLDLRNEAENSYLHRVEFKN